MAFQHSLLKAQRASAERIETLKHAISSDSLALFPDYNQRLSVLKSLGYVDAASDTVELKGRVASQINTCEELVLTELVFEGALADLDAAELAALLSALVFQEKCDDVPSATPGLMAACDAARKIARSLGQVQKKHGLAVDPKEYEKVALNFGLCDVVYSWASGIPFRDIASLTLIHEGSIVRTVTRLDEVCREVRQAARVIGNPVLFLAAQEASRLIKRDIVFFPSLYV